MNITIATQLKAFNNSTSEMLCLDFPMTKKERENVHQLCAQLKLDSTSIGDGEAKKMLIRKKVIDTLSDAESSSIPGLLQVHFTDEDRKRFIKDFKLPIEVYVEPYFSYFLNLYDEMFSTEKKYQIYIDAVQRAGLQGAELKKVYQKVAAQFVKTITGFDEYVAFIKSENKKEPVELPNETVIWNLQHFTKYQTITVEAPFESTSSANSATRIIKSVTRQPKYYISCDIREANFNALKYVNPKIVLDSNTWKELIKKVTENPFLVESKQLRQIMFGKLNGKRIAVVQRQLLSFLYLLLKDSVKIVGRMSNDEFFIETTRETIQQDHQIVMSVVDALPDNMKGIWRITPMFIHPLSATKGFIMHTILDIDDQSKTKVSIKGVEKKYFAQAFKHYMNMPLVDADLKIMDNSNVYTADEPFDFGDRLTD